MLRINSINHDAIMLLLKPGPRQEFRIPIINTRPIGANCEFKILEDGYNSNMHTFFVMPFRFLIPPGETVRIVLTIKYNVAAYYHEEFKKRTEMRKLLNVRLKDTKINIGFPILIKLGQQQTPVGRNPGDDFTGFLSGGGGGGNKIRI